MKPFLLVLTLLLTQTPQDVGSIEGFVVRMGTSDPVARARVVLSKDGGPPGAQAVTTDGGGRFFFQDIQPGRYRISVNRDGYVRAEYGQRGPNLPGSVVEIAPRQMLRDLRVGLIPTGAITGRVTDRYGDPVGNASVQAMKYAFQDGRRTLNVVQATRTNDLGEYRLFWMQPGQYIVSAVPREGFLGEMGTMVLDFNPGVAGEVSRAITVTQANATAMPRAISGVLGGFGPNPAMDTSETYIPVYYPGTTDAAGAAPIDLRAGVNYAGVDLTVVDTRAVRIRGRVIYPASSQTGASVMLIPRGTVGGGIQAQRNVPVSENGAFELRGIAPGAYDLVANSGRQMFRFSSADGTTVTSSSGFSSGGFPPGNPNEPRLGGRVSIDVGTADVDNVTITLQPGFNLSGRVVVEGRSASDANSGIGNIRVLLRPDPLIPPLMPVTPGAATGGIFTLTGVFPGDYRVSIAGIPRNFYVKSMRLGATDVSDMKLRIEGENAGSLDILIGTNPGMIDAMVVDDKQQPVAGVMAVLVPDEPRRLRTDLYRTATTDVNGRVHLEGVAPGDYKLFSWDNVEPGAWFDPDFIRVHNERGRAVHISEGGRENADIRLIPYR